MLICKGKHVPFARETERSLEEMNARSGRQKCIILNSVRQGASNHRK